MLTNSLEALVFLIPHVFGRIVEPDVQGIVDCREVPSIDVQELGVGRVVRKQEGEPICLNALIPRHLRTLYINLMYLSIC